MRVPGRGSLLLALLLVGCSRGAAPVDMAANERDSYDSGSMGAHQRDSAQ